MADTCTFPLTGEEPIVHVTGYLDYMSKKEDLALKLLELRAERIVVDEHFNKNMTCFLSTHLMNTPIFRRN